MMSITPLQQADSPRHLELGQALALVQAMHRHLEPQALLGVLWGQARLLTRASGMRYRHSDHGLDVEFGDGPHRASYTLTHQGTELGELEFRFEQRVDETALAIAEDLLALAMPAIRNALSFHRTSQRAAHADNVEIIATPPVRSRMRRRAGVGEPGTASDDALVLVSLDGFQEIRGNHGDAWAQTLIDTIAEQVREGLRDADSVFQIDEGLLAVLLPRTSETAALDVAGKIRVLIAGLHLRDGRLASQLTACMGVAGAKQEKNPEAVLEKAQAALGAAISEGSNTIRAATAAHLTTT
ncbi:MAG: diguanylate cyclase [Pseudomonadales bacterium]